jgi:hypothetical protein
MMTTEMQENFHEKILDVLNEFDGKLLVEEAIMSLVTLAYQLAVEQAENPEEGIDFIYEVLDSIAETEMEEGDFSEEDEMTLES